jgi:hypothetical protein
MAKFQFKNDVHYDVYGDDVVHTSSVGAGRGPITNAVKNNISNLLQDKIKAIHIRGTDGTHFMVSVTELTSPMVQAINCRFDTEQRDYPWLAEESNRQLVRQWIYDNNMVAADGDYLLQSLIAVEKATLLGLDAITKAVIG